MNQEIITRYIGQPARLPDDAPRALERAWNGEPIQLYALADLDHTLKLERVVAGVRREPRRARAPASDGAWDDRERRALAHAVAARRRPASARTRCSSSATRARRRCSSCATRSGSARAVENIRFVLDEALTGRSVTLDDADRVYADAVARPVRDAQALVSGRESRGDVPPAPLPRAVPSPGDASVSRRRRS